MDKRKFFASLERRSQDFTFANGQTVTLRELTEGGRGRLMDKKNDTDLNAWVLAWGCDEFTEGDVPSIRNMPMSAVEPAVQVILRLSAIASGPDAPVTADEIKNVSRATIN